MFGIGRTDRRGRRGGTFSGNNLRNAAIAGAGMLALRWWRNRQSSKRPARPGEPATTRDAEPIT